MQLQSQSRTYSRYNVLAQTTQPMDVSDQLLSKLAVLSQQKQWILFTAECPRPDFEQLTASNICCKNVIQMKRPNSFLKSKSLSKPFSLAMPARLSHQTKLLL